MLGDCLASIAAQTHLVGDVIVVDGASTDGSRRVTEEHGARFLPAPNRGLGFLYNRGVDATDAELVLLLNNDVALDARCVELLAAELRRDKSRFAADANQLDWSGGSVVHARTTLRRGRLFHEHIPGLHLDPLVPSDRVIPVVCANGAAMMARRSMFRELEGFDETFFMEWEDLDLCWRAWLRGWPTVYVPSALVRHRVGAVTTATVAPRRAASSHHNLVRFALKCLPSAAAGRVVTGEILRLPAHPRAIASGLAAATREAPDIVRLRRSLKPSAEVFNQLLGL